MIGAVTGIVICLWWGIGAMVSGIRPTTLPLRIDGCVTENNTWIDLTETTTDNISEFTSINNDVISSPTSGYPAPPYPGQDDRYINYDSFVSHNFSCLAFTCYIRTRANNVVKVPGIHLVRFFAPFCSRKVTITNTLWLSTLCFR